MDHRAALRHHATRGNLAAREAVHRGQEEPVDPPAVVVDLLAEVRVIGVGCGPCRCPARLRRSTPRWPCVTRFREPRRFTVDDLAALRAEFGRAEVTRCERVVAVPDADADLARVRQPARRRRAGPAPSGLVNAY